MNSVSRMWTGSAVLLLAAMMLIGVAMAHESPFFALSPLGPLVLAGAGAFVFALALGQRWALICLLVGAILVFSVDWRGSEVEVLTQNGAGFKVEAEVETSKDPFEPTSLLKLGVFLLAIATGAGALRALGERALEPQGILLTLYFCWAFMTAALSASPLYTFGATLGLASWILFAIAVNEQIRLKEIVLLVISAGGIFCIGSLVAFVLFPAYGSFLSLGEVRLTGLSATPNAAGQIAVICLVSIYAFHLSGFSYSTLSARWRWWLWTCGLTAVAVLLLSGTRGALAAGLIAAVAIAVRQLRATRGALIVGVLVLLLGAIAVASTPATTKLIANLAGGVSRSGEASEVWELAGRANLWGFVVDRIADKPIKGYGYGAGAKVIQENYRTMWGETTGSAHNAFLQSALDLGLVGGGLLIAVFVWSFRQFLGRPCPFRDAMFVIVLVTCLLESAIAKAASPIALLWIVSLFVKPEDAEPATVPPAPVPTVAGAESTRPL